ncbi:creatininase family protein [Nonomuraea sp. NPDC055795]
MTNELARMTTKEAGRALAAAGVAILPVGACEQHGPHLSLDTDMGIADAFARRLAADLGAQAVLCPPVPYGLSEHHLAFPGTLTLRPATYLALLADLAESLAHHGLRRILVVNGHGGNTDPIRLAARELRRDHGVEMAHLMWALLAADTIAELIPEGRYGHACQSETSVAMAIAPHLVRLDLIGPPAPGAPPDRDTDPPSGRVDLPVAFETWTDSGALGDARLAGAEMGQKIVEAAYERAIRFARRFAAGQVRR